MRIKINKQRYSMDSLSSHQESFFNKTCQNMILSHLKSMERGHLSLTLPNGKNFIYGKDLKLPKGTVFIGELGLGGQLRPVSQISQRLQEVERLGFKRVVLPKKSVLESDEISNKIELIQVDNINEAILMTLGVDR